MFYLENIFFYTQYLFDMVELLEHYDKLHFDAQKHLPFRTSTIPFEIILKVSIRTLKNESYGVKDLMVDLPYSNMGIRNHLRTLITDGWLTLSPNDDDRRCRNLKASERCLEALRAFLETGHDPPPPPRSGGSELALIPQATNLGVL